MDFLANENALILTKIFLAKVNPKKAADIKATPKKIVSKNDLKKINPKKHAKKTEAPIKKILSHIESTTNKLTWTDSKKYQQNQVFPERDKRNMDNDIIGVNKPPENDYCSY